MLSNLLSLFSVSDRTKNTLKTIKDEAVKSFKIHKPTIKKFDLDIYPTEDGHLVIMFDNLGCDGLGISAKVPFAAQIANAAHLAGQGNLEGSESTRALSGN